MPIRGMTDTVEALFPKLGDIRKGAAKAGNRPGQDLNEKWRITSPDLAVMRLVSERLGDGAEPKRGVDAQGRTMYEVVVGQDIPITFLFPTVEENFEAWREEWVSGGLKHRCDGQTVYRWLGDDGQYYNKEDLAPGEQYLCPGGCKQAGRLKVFIRPLGRLGYFTVQTTAKNDIVTIQQNLMAIQSITGQLSGISCLLGRRPRRISTPPRNPGGPRTRVEKWLITVEVDPDAVMKVLTAAARRAQLLLESPDMKALPAPSDMRDLVPLIAADNSAELVEEEDDEDERPQVDPRMAKMISKLRDLHRLESTDLMSEVPPTELALDFEQLAYDDLVAIGTRAAGRVQLLRGGDQVGYTQLWEQSDQEAGKLLAKYGIEVLTDSAVEVVPAHDGAAEATNEEAVLL